MCSLLIGLGDAEAVAQRALAALQHLGAPPPGAGPQLRASLLRRLANLPLRCLTPSCTSLGQASLGIDQALSTPQLEGINPKSSFPFPGGSLQPCPWSILL